MDNNDILLHTERLVLKVIDEEYAAQVVDYYLRNKEFLKKWDPLRSKEFYTVDYQRNELMNEAQKIKDNRMFKVRIFKTNGDEGRIIGQISLNNIVRGCFESCHLGYSLDKDEINQGYMTEGVNAMIRFAFDALGLHRIEANIMPENAASLRVVQKLGFCNEGLAKKYLKINGKWEDHIHWVLLNDALE